MSLADAPLAFPCVVTRVTAAPSLHRSRTWVQGRDFREIAAAAAEQLNTGPEHCLFTLVEPDSPPGRVFLEVVYEDAEALVGPMAGPRRPPPILEMPRDPLDVLLDRLGLAGHNTGSGDQSGLRHVVTVRYSSIWHGADYPPVRKAHERLTRYQTRCNAAECTRVERASHQGFFSIHYPVPADNWAALDLTHVIELVYRHLPMFEPPSGESGWISRTTSDESRTPCFLQVTRGDYVASMDLPVFPTLALTEWLHRRRCTIDLHHPVRTLRPCGDSTRGDHLAAAGA